MDGFSIVALYVDDVNLGWISNGIGENSWLFGKMIWKGRLGKNKILSQIVAKKKFRWDIGTWFTIHWTSIKVI